MVFYKLYAEKEEGLFTSHYQDQFMSRPITIGETITWKTLKPEWVTEDDPDAFYAPIFGCKTPEECIPFFKEYFPVDSYEEDCELFGQALTLVECEGQLRDWEDPSYGICDLDDEELFFDTQTITKVIRRYTYEEVCQWIKEAHEENK